MLELLLKSEEVYEKPYLALAYSVFAVTLSIFLSLLIFKEISSFPIIFFTAVAVAPVLISSIERDELHQGNVFKRYQRSVTLFGMMFFGMAFAFALWYAILPSEMLKTVFELQLKKVPFAAGYFSFNYPLFWSIFLNNIGLLAAFFLLSLFYGYGSVLLLVWNASILGFIWGNAIRFFVQSASVEGIVRHVIVAGPYLIPEVVAYFLAAIGGGILYVNLVKHKNRDALAESVALLIVSSLLILLGAIVETMILASL